MTKHQSETLSALLDGQFEDIDNTEQAVQELVENASQRERWFRYQLSAAVIKGEAQVGLPFDISAAVAAEVARQPAYQQQLAQQRWWQQAVAWLQHGWVRPVANVAVAAGVAIVAIVGVQSLQRVDDGMMANPLSGSSSPLQGFETMPLGGVINPVSFNTVHPASDVQDTDMERRLLQSFFVDHHQQLQFGAQDELLNTDVPAATPVQPEEID